MGEWVPLEQADLEKRWAEEAARPIPERAADCVRLALLPDDDPDRADPVAWELVLLWSDLEMARHHAMNRTWSIECDHLTSRIALLTRHFGRPTPWEKVGISLIEVGVYQAINDAIGLPYDPPDMQRVAEVRASINTRLDSL
jgi:hypothetical protein